MVKWLSKQVTPEKVTRDTILDYADLLDQWFAQGVPYGEISARCGLTDRSFNTWIKTGKRDTDFGKDTALARFYARFRTHIEARSQGKVAVVGRDGKARKVHLTRRQTYLTEDLIEQFCVMRAQGAPITRIAEPLGIPPERLNVWLSKGRQHLANGTPSIYRILVERMAQAEWELMNPRIRTVMQASDAGDTKSAQWILERFFPKDFLPPKQLEITEHSDKPTIAINVLNTGDVANLQEFMALVRKQGVLPSPVSEQVKENEVVDIAYEDSDGEDGAEEPNYEDLEEEDGDNR